MKRRKYSASHEPSGYFFIAPYYIFYLIFIAFPILVNIGLSFTNFNLRTLDYVGFDNYKRLALDTFFHKSVVNTIIYVLWTVGFNLLLGIAVALALNKKGVLAHRIFRSIYYLPHVTSMVAISMVWLWLFEPSAGFFNVVMKFFNLPSQNWLYDERLALPCIIAMAIWKNFGYYMTVFLAGLTNVPSYLYEAAVIDGANSLHRFRYITMPMLRPITFFLLITGTVNAFNVFEQVNIMTGGGPMNATTTIVHQIYTRSFTEYKFGYGAAQAIVLFIVVIVFTSLNFRYGNQGQDLDVG